MLVELAGCDPELLIWLIDNGNVTLDNYLNVLGILLSREDGHMSGYKILRQKLAHFPPGWICSALTSLQLAPDVATGHHEWDVDEGVVMHSAALALLQDELALEHRIWRGAKALLPILDGRRLQICRFLDRSSHDWRKFCNYANENGWERSLSPHSGEPIAEYGTIVDSLRMLRLMRHGGGGIGAFWGTRKLFAPGTQFFGSLYAAAKRAVYNRCWPTNSNM